MTCEYDQDYFERGTALGISLYDNYRWIPELTIPLAMSIIDLFGITRDEKILDIGCAKGFLVKAFRTLYRQAWGIDSSVYAINKAHDDVKEFCFVCNHDHTNLPDMSRLPEFFDFAIAKDVFEHIPVPDLEIILRNLNSERLFAVIPLGDGKVYRVPAYNLDRSHVVCEDEKWWLNFFERNNWHPEVFSYRVQGIKDNWASHRNGNGFFSLKRTL